MMGVAYILFVYVCHPSEYIVEKKYVIWSYKPTLLISLTYIFFVFDKDKVLVNTFIQHFWSIMYILHRLMTLMNEYRHRLW